MVPAGVTFDPVVSAPQAGLSAQSQRVMLTEGGGGSQMLSGHCGQSRGKACTCTTAERC